MRCFSRAFFALRCAARGPCGRQGRASPQSRTARLEVVPFPRALRASLRQQGRACARFLSALSLARMSGLKARPTRPDLPSPAPSKPARGSKEGKSLRSCTARMNSCPSQGSRRVKARSTSFRASPFDCAQGRLCGSKEENSPACFSAGLKAPPLQGRCPSQDAPRFGGEGCEPGRETEAGTAASAGPGTPSPLVFAKSSKPKTLANRRPQDRGGKGVRGKIV
jgi:hypothetical protein